MNAFETAYQRLNPQQKEAVDTLEGPVMVLAGPGTGKTQIMSVRIANILRKLDVQPQNILALTFTNAAAKNLQTRLTQLIGAAAYGVKCTTFHSFCATVIEEHGEFFPVLPSVQEPVSTLEQIGIMEQIFDENEFVHLKNPKYPYFYVRDALQSLLNYKREGHSPLTIRQLAEEELAALEQSDLPAYKRRQQELQVRKNIDLAEIYSEYQRLMAERHWFDFEDLILWVRDALRENEDLRLIYQEKYQYFLIDEYQDTNEGQLQVVRELASFWGDQANIFVVGDPNQSIYRFQGASLANTLSFLDHYPQAAVITLVTGYRCGNEIYQAAAELIGHNPLEVKDERLAALAEPLTHWENHSATIALHQAVTPLAETLWIAQQLLDRHQEGIPFGEMAVLYRKHKNADLLKEVLQSRQIPFQVNEQTDVFASRTVNQILTLLKFFVVLRSQQEGPVTLAVLQLPWLGIDAQDALTVVREASHSAVHRQEPWALLQDKEAFAKLSLRAPEKLVAVQTLLIELQDKEINEPLTFFVEEALRETGFYAWSQAQKLGASELVAVASFLRHLQNWAKRDQHRHLENLLTDIQRMKEHGLVLQQEPLTTVSDAVTLATAHQAKGQEWTDVFILQSQDKIWGNLRSVDRLKPLSGMIPYADLEKAQLNEDERRLFYVALTRAKNTVTFTLSERETDGDRTTPLQPTQFIAELPSTKMAITDPLSPEAVIEELRLQFSQRQTKQLTSDLDQAWLESLVTQFSFSFTALQEFLNCPLSFFYRRLIRVPERPAPALAIGTAVHASLEHLYLHLNKEGEVADLPALHQVIRRQMRQFDFSPTQLDALEAQAQSMVTNYYEAQEGNWKPSLLVERFFGREPQVVFEDLPLVGKIDRIDLIDPLGKQVRVIDYKTGQVHSRNDILGKTASSDGSMIRQLVFYRLLSELDPTFQYQVKEGEFVFIEPSKGGKFVTERFEILDEQVEELKQVLRQVKEEFLSLSFLEKEPCGHCDACRSLGLQPSKIRQYESYYLSGEKEQTLPE
jgi:DNA helicase-2/ATP-dependent DNA helicase PcrA